MSEFLRQLGYDPLYYWFGFGGAFFLLVVSAILPGPPAQCVISRLNTPPVFGALLLVSMCAGRWPGVVYYRAVNPDESQFLAGAITMLARGEFWWIDSTTSGPLVVLPLALPGLFGLPVDLQSGRVIALLLSWAVVFFVYLILRHFHGDWKSRVLVLPLACFMIFLLFWDFVPYCSELSPLFLCALALWLGVTAFQPDMVLRSRWRLAAGGLVLGLLPFSKFQVLPLVVAIGLSMFIWSLRQPTTDRQKIRHALCSLLGGSAVGLTLMLIALWHSGETADFYASYLVHNLNYAQARAMPWLSSGYSLFYLTGFSWGFASFHYGLLLLLGLSMGGVCRSDWKPLLPSWLLLFAAYFAVLVPGRLYPHYLLLLSLPIGLLAGLQFGFSVQSAVRARRTCVALWSIFFILGVGVQAIDRGYDRHALTKLVPSLNSRTSTIGFLNQVKRPGDTLAVWGWRPEFYVETQLPQATREAHTNAQLIDGPQRDYFRVRFLADLRISQPAFFIDSVGPDDFGHHDPARDGHETFPELGEYIRQEYAQVSKERPFRVYVRRTLLDRPH